MGRIAIAAAAGVFVLLLAVITIVGGGQIAATTAPDGGCAVAVSGPGTAGGPQHDAVLTAPQMAIARTIVGVGKSLHITQRGTAIALGTAMQESSLNPENTDGYGIGIFQQQGELYATVNKKNPAAAAQAFYRLLLARVPNYNNPDPRRGGITLADAAQEVQRSGAGAGFYARWEAWASGLARQLFFGTAAVGGADGTAGGAPGAGSVAINCTAAGRPGPVAVTLAGLTVQVPQLQNQGLGVLRFPDPRAARAVAAALTWLGTPYAWGGGGPAGPTQGARDGGVADGHGDYRRIGFDCSGLTQYAWAHAGIDLPRTSAEQQAAGRQLPFDQVKPGDLVFHGTPVHHVALYLGAVGGTSYVVEAPESGGVVSVAALRTGGDFLATVVRPY